MNSHIHPALALALFPQGPVFMISPLYMEPFCAYLCVASLDCVSFLSRPLNKTMVMIPEVRDLYKDKKKSHYAVLMPVSPF